MAFTQIDLAVADGIATLTLNRPDRLNAFTGTMMHEMIAAFDQTDADDSVRAVIVTGAGRAFCAGADLSEGAKTFDYENRTDANSTRLPSPSGEGSGVGPGVGESGTRSTPTRPDGTTDYSHPAVRDGGGRLTLRIFESLKPVIGAINGAAVGVGATMQLPMDIRIASTAARFGFVFARRGIVPEAASSWFLPRLVGIAQAMEWCATGRLFDAAEAHAGGLVSRVVEPDALLATATALAREIADNTAPVSVTLTRQMLWRMLGADHPMEAHKVDSRAIWARGRQGDAREGVMSFLEKRPARYPDTVSKDLPDFYPWWPDRPYA
ncbi:crotonase/enoyl-CoA hydratase family protein [Sandaracinobacteroides saxicola]|uniref:Crotonase/enoyl-CoA hydratase family protein n=1 Tax=Sandaracinobacteroides saxicola TaxID=2759707 RepID=A0A7G5IHU4_9SPHN|nr:crotonase/enoyl-CoA hydratase family protein [Sandaracinobacteroides saxicola]QMW22936.1 crotonase/enoyl-CoA hydratase family protein [Sandaracinobacteroides saxicola]